MLTSKELEELVEGSRKHPADVEKFIMLRRPYLLSLCNIRFQLRRENGQEENWRMRRDLGTHSTMGLKATGPKPSVPYSVGIVESYWTLRLVVGMLVLVTLWTPCWSLKMTYTSHTNTPWHKELAHFQFHYSRSQKSSLTSMRNCDLIPQRQNSPRQSPIQQHAADTLGSPSGLCCAYGNRIASAFLAWFPNTGRYKNIALVSHSIPGQSRSC